MNFDPSVDCVINDIGKIIAAKAGKQYIIVGTAPSMDGYASATSAKKTPVRASERVEKVRHALDGDAVRAKIKDFRTALHPRQYHPCVLENRFTRRFSLKRSFPPHMSPEKQKSRRKRRELPNFRFFDNLRRLSGRLSAFYRARAFFLSDLL